MQNRQLSDNIFPEFVRSKTKKIILKSRSHKMPKDKPPPTNSPSRKFDFPHTTMLNYPRVIKSHLNFFFYLVNYLCFSQQLQKLHFCTIQYLLISMHTGVGPHAITPHCRSTAVMGIVFPGEDFFKLRKYGKIYGSRAPSGEANSQTTPPRIQKLTKFWRKN